MPRRSSVRVASLRCLVATAAAAACMVPCASWAGPVAAVGAEDERHQARGDELMTKGDAHQAAGGHVKAARAYAKAFDAFAARSRRDAKEMQAVSLAMDEYRLAQQEQPESLALLEEEATLLERFEAPAEHEGAMSDELARLRTKIDELRQAEQRRNDAEKGAARERSRRDEAILGSGVAGIVGGVALLGGGVWVLGATDVRRDAQRAELDANEYPNEAERRDELREWHQRGLRIATGLVVSGAVLTGVGIGLMSWWAVRHSRTRPTSKRRVSVTVPVIAPGRVGLTTIVRF